MVSLLSQPADVCPGNALLLALGPILGTVKCIGNHSSQRLFRTPLRHLILRLQIMPAPKRRALQHPQDEHGRIRFHYLGPRKKWSLPQGIDAKVTDIGLPAKEVPAQGWLHIITASVGAPFKSGWSDIQRLTGQHFLPNKLQRHLQPRARPGHECRQRSGVCQG